MYVILGWDRVQILVKSESSVTLTNNINTLVRQEQPYNNIIRRMYGVGKINYPHVLHKQQCRYSSWLGNGRLLSNCITGLGFFGIRGLFLVIEGVLI